MATETKRMRVRQSDRSTARSKNETLRLGEFFMETDTGEVKIGNGTSKYRSLLGIRSEAEIAEQIAQGIYEGTNLEEKFADEIASYSSVADWLHARCASNNFKGIYPFDYFYDQSTAATIDDKSVAATRRKCVIAAIDPYYNAGDTAMPHHVTIFAGLSQYTVMFNSTNNNNGSAIDNNPWKASKLYAVMNGVNNASTNNIGAVGFDSSSGGYLQTFSSSLRNRMVEQRCFLPTRYNSSSTLTDHAGWEWKGRGILFAPSEIEAYGCLIHSNKPTMTAQNPEGFGPYCQFPIFRSAGGRGRLMNGRASWWLSSVAGGSSTACIVDGNGLASCVSTTYTNRHAPLCFHIA